VSALVDDEARARIRGGLDVNMVVEAAAGTGKTTELVRRIVAVLEQGRGTVDSLVAVTFTEKAAGELKLRLRAAIDRARQEARGAARSHLDDALARLEEARVNTIHGFCAELLRERPVEARVDPRFRVMTEGESRALFALAFRRWLQGVLEDPPEGVRRALRRLPASGEPSDRLRQAAWSLAEWRDFPAPWRRDPFEREAAIDLLVERLDALVALRDRASSRDVLWRDTEPARRLREEIATAERTLGRDYDRLEGAFVALATAPSYRDFRRPREGRGRWFGRELERGEVLRSHRVLLDSAVAFSARADADLAPLLHRELRAVVGVYEDLKRRSGRLDFLDLLLLARDLIRDDDGMRAGFQRRFTHIFVDEFQDTDPLQAEILLLLAGADPAVRKWREIEPAPGKLFLVGDPKQSIYRFRRADVGLYLEVRDLLVARGAECVQLTTSFRAVPSIQRFVNAAFSRAMRGDAATLQADHVPLSPRRAEHASQPAIVALPVPRPLGKRGGVTATAVEASLPDATGAFVDWLLRESGWTVSERERPGERVPVSARHICLLFRRFDAFAGDMTRGYVQALEARGIPHLLVGGSSFHAREEVETLRAALCGIEWPEDELSVFATLRGSLFALGDENLFEYRHAVGRLHPFRVPEALPPHLASIGEALRFLAELHRGRNGRTVAETIALLLEATRAPAGLVLRPSGEQVLANVLHLSQLARAYESAGGISFRGFVQQLLAEADGGRAAEAPILEEGSDGVRLMTVHKAKGLEFPVVILADMTAQLVRPPANRWLDTRRGLAAVRLAGWSPAELLEHQEAELARDAAEGVRVAYVAATRARDLLVVPAVGVKELENGWASPLNAALYPPRTPAGWREPARSSAAGCPPFGSTSLLGSRAAASAPESVRPGCHEFETGHAAVWWDPNILHLDAQPLFGIRQEELIGKDAPADVVAADLECHERWRAARAAALERGARPSLLVDTATARAAASTAVPEEVEVVEVSRSAERPSGARFGSLVHAALAEVDLGADRGGIEAVVRMHARILGATPEETEGSVLAIEAALGHPLVVRARVAAARGECRRETPLTLREADGTLVEGVADLAFRDGGRWTVVDFKTDRELAAAARAVYERQVSLYARAVGEATGEPAVAVLMRV
jgi:ATP-dependent exoDNAse (exonuclease V) beta subunit